MPALGSTGAAMALAAAPYTTGGGVGAVLGFDEEQLVRVKPVAAATWASVCLRRVGGKNRIAQT